MFRNPTFAVILVTIYLIVYCVLLQRESTLELAFILFLLSPIFVGWMVYSILRFGKYTGRKLSEGEEYGYEDR